MKIIYIDTETGGPNPKHCCLLQLSGAIEIDWVIKKKFNFFMRPFPEDPEITKEAINKHGITKEIIANQPEKFIDPTIIFDQFITMLSEYVSQYNKYDKFQFVGYNSQGFDDPVLRSFFDKNGCKYYGSWFWHPTIDVMQLYAGDWADKRHELLNFQLLTVAKAAGIKVDESKLHDGLYDIQITRELYLRRERKIYSLNEAYKKLKQLQQSETIAKIED